MIVSPKLGSPPLKGEVSFYHASDEMTEGSRGRQQNLKLFEIYFVTFYLYGFSNLLIYSFVLYFSSKYAKIFRKEMIETKTNFHTHCQRCRHAFGTEKDYLKSAIEKNLDQLGFSDHAPFPDHDFGNRMPFEELPDYISAIEQLKQKYPIPLFKGLEIEYFPKYSDYYKRLFGEYGIEYLILGEHFYTAENGDIKNIYFAESTLDYIYYAQSVCDGIETGFFKFVAHPDLMFLNMFGWDGNCTKACEMIIECAEKHNAVLEFNANGYRRQENFYPDGRRFPYPHINFWRMVKNTNVRVIIGSDCHEPHQIFDEKVELAYKTADMLGLNVIDTIF